MQKLLNYLNDLIYKKFIAKKTIATSVDIEASYESDSEAKIWPNHLNVRNVVYQFVEQTLRAFSNGFALPFFTGRPIIPDIPHVNATTIFGSVLDAKSVEMFERVAKQNPHGLASFWFGGIPAFYITSNRTRRAIIKENKVGSVTEADAKFLERLSFDNYVMCKFPAFMARNETYKMQRKFLLGFFHNRTADRLPNIISAAYKFLEEHEAMFVLNPVSIRDFSMGLILRTSSYLFGLTNVPMDKRYFTDPEYKRQMDHVVLYGISGIGNITYEKKLYDIFVYILENNYQQIKTLIERFNMLGTIFASHNVKMPDSFEAFQKWDEPRLKHTIAMNYMAIVPGGKIHSTGNTLDWALASLLIDHQRLAELIVHVNQHKDTDFTDLKNYNYGQPLYPFFKLVAETLIKHPPFSHQFFYNPESYEVLLDNPPQRLVFPAGSIFFPNYVACNESEGFFEGPNKFDEFLKEVVSPHNFRNNNRVASFGGSDLNKENTVTRRCPAAATSIVEISAILAIIVLKYGVRLQVWQENISLEADCKQHPIHARKSLGRISLPLYTSYLSSSESDDKSSIPKSIKERFFTETIMRPQ